MIDRKESTMASQLTLLIHLRSPSCTERSFQMLVAHVGRMLNLARSREFFDDAESVEVHGLAINVVLEFIP